MTILVFRSLWSIQQLLANCPMGSTEFSKAKVRNNAVTWKRLGQSKPEID